MQISEAQLIANKCWYIAKPTIYKQALDGMSINSESIGTILESVPEVKEFLPQDKPQLICQVSRSIFELVKKNAKGIEQGMTQVRIGFEMVEQAGKSINDIWKRFVVSTMPGFVSLQKQFEGDFDGYKKYMAQLLGLSLQELQFPCEDLHARIFKLARCSDKRKEEFSRAINDLAKILNKEPKSIDDILRTIVEYFTEINNLANILIPPEQRVQILKEFEKEVKSDPNFRAIYEKCHGDYDLLERMLLTPFMGS